MYRRALGISATLLVLAGCGGGSEPATTTVASATTEATATTAAGESVGLDEVLQALQRTVGSTGRLTERQDYALGTDTVGFSSTTSFDGTSGNIEVVRTVTSSPPEAVAAVTDGASVEDLEAEVRYIDGVLYLTMPGWPDDRRGRWLRFTSTASGAAMAENGLALDGDSAYPSRLFSLIDDAEPTALRSAAPDGATTYRLTVPASLAGAELETRVLQALLKAGRDAGDLTGTVDLDVVVGGDGTITSATMDASALFAQVVELTGGQGAAQPRLVISMTVDELGVPLTVELPAENLVDDV